MYRFFTSRDIHPTGWLKQQLEIEARGLAGHLDTMWPDVRDSAWIGGSPGGLGAGALLAGRLYSSGLFAGG